MAKRYIALVAVLAVMALVACDDAPESGRTIVSIQDFNLGTPVQSDVVVDNGTDPAYISEDLIPVTFTARPYNAFITGTTHNQVVIESYHVVWTRTDGGTGTLATRDEASSIYVSVGDETEAFIRLVTWGDKAGPVLSPLIGSANQISMRADVTFTGREVGTEEEIELSASVSVNFSDAVNIE
ncbi:MAG TPA: hypothetical protein VEC56_06110 [Candidatus Krumholzibacteria bacterium]|nr:hypothetical protein [Candidatus Krumholzibacteria bacterium]